MLECCHGSDLHESCSDLRKLVILCLGIWGICLAKAYRAHLLKDTSFCGLRNALDGTVAYCLLLPPLVHSRVLAMAQNLEQTA